MTRRGWSWVVIGALATATASIFVWHAGELAADASAHAHDKHPAPAASQPFKAFYAQVREAEKIPDPLQRCLRIPDPPGTHWHRDTTEAYCRYRAQPVLSFEEARAMVFAYKARQLDEKFAEYRHGPQQGGGPQAHIEHAYTMLDFSCNCGKAIAMVDRWLGQQPNSPYALTASGLAWLGKARQDGMGRLGPSQASMDDINRAQHYLDKSIAIDPTLMPTLTAMMMVADFRGDKDALAKATQAALAIDPYSYTVQLALKTSKPASLSALISGQGDDNNLQSLVAHNPRLRLLLAERSAGGLRTYDPRAAAAAMIDHDVTALTLERAADRVADNDPALAAMLYGEAIRFEPGDALRRRQFAAYLGRAGEISLARDEFEALIHDDPHDVPSRDNYAQMLNDAGDTKGAEAAFLALVAEDPGNIDGLGQLGKIYDNSQRPDQAMAVANQLIAAHPDEPNGYIIKASIQRDYHRPGLHQTLEYYVTHFADRPDQGIALGEMRAYLRAHPND